MTEVPPMRRVPIILNIPSLSRIRQPIREPHLLHNLRLRQGLSILTNRQRLTPTLLGPRKRHKRMHLALHDPRNRRLGIEPRGDGPTSRLNSRDSRRRSPRHNDMDRLLEHTVDGNLVVVFLHAAAEKLHAFFGLMDAARLSEFADRDGTGWVDAALVDPGLDPVEVHGGEVDGVNIIKPPLTMNNNIRRLTTIKRSGDLSMLLLTLVTSSGGFTLTGGRTTTSSDALVVGALGIGERGEDVRVPTLLVDGWGQEEGGEEVRRGGGHGPLPLEGQQLEPGRHGAWCGG